jgi:hypothetical protein
MKGKPNLQWLLAAAVTTACGSAVALAAMGSPAMAQEQPVATEKNPPGDIPDSQVFILYRSPLGFSLKIPEGWARADRTDGASFADKYDSVDVSVASAAAAPTAESAVNNDVVALMKSARAAKVSAVKDVRLPAGPAVLIVYTSNSAPNAVTSKQIRIENNRYLYYRAGKLVTLDLSAPAGADNVDQWKLMSDSFHWN